MVNLYNRNTMIRKVVYLSVCRHVYATFSVHLIISYTAITERDVSNEQQVNV